MKSHEAIQTAIAGNTIEHAKRLRLSTSIIHKWQEPSVDFTDSGSLNPLDRTESIVETSLALGIRRELALAPVQYLNERFDIIGISIRNGTVCHKELTKELLLAVKEFGELAACSSKALIDNLVSKKENEAVQREGWRLLRQVALFMHHTKEAAGLKYF